jgi:hypothetical protein
MSLDSLAYAQMENIMTQDSDYKFWKSQNLTGIGPDTPNDQINTKLNSILSNTTLKRACCLAKPDQRPNSDPNVWEIDVRIPVPNVSKFQSETGTQLVDEEKNYYYFDKTIYIPKTMCNSIKSSDGSSSKYSRPQMGDTNINNKCDVFYNTYCNNILTAYKQQATALGKSPDLNEFATTFKRECACYNPISPSVHVSKRCLLYPQCTKSDNTYLDPESRGVCPSSLTICNQAINLSEAEVGGNVVISSELKEKCGPELNPTSNNNNNAGGNNNNNAGNNNNNNTGGNNNNNAGNNNNNNAGGNNNNNNNAGGNNNNNAGNNNNNNSGGNNNNNTGNNNNNNSGGSNNNSNAGENSKGESESEGVEILGIPELYFYIGIAVIVLIIIAIILLFVFRKRK